MRFGNCDQDQGEELEGGGALRILEVDLPVKVSLGLDLAGVAISALEVYFCAELHPCQAPEPECRLPLLGQ